MKKISKILSLLLALTMVLSMNLGVLTAHADSYTIKINESTTDYKYEAYQIFDGDLSGNTQGSYVLSNIVWGTNISKDGTPEYSTVMTAVKEITIDNSTYPFENCTSAADVADVLKDLSKDAALLQEFADVISKYITGSGVASEYKTDHYEISISDPGYYLVKNTSAPDEDGVYTRFILLVVGDVEATPKSAVPSVEKKVYEESYNSVAQEISDYGTYFNDVADYDIGDSIDFKFIGTLPDNLSSYSTYKYVFHDTMDAGLTFDSDSVVVTIDGTTVPASYSGTTNYTVVYDASSAQTDGCTFEISFSDILSLVDSTGAKISVSSTSKVVVTYEATLNENAKIGLPGNVNEVYLQYSNNPNEGGSGDTGTTPKDKVIVFTYELDVTKVDGTDNTKTLENAEFKLYKEVSGVKYYAKVTNGKVTGWTTDPDEAAVLTSGTDGKFSIAGLDDGTYFLLETKAPTGYNLLSDPVELTITANTVNGQSWSGTATDALAACDSNTDPDSASLTITVGTAKTSGNSTDGTVGTTVANNTGATLPETGGMGTKIFYTLGGILVVCAGVLLIVKRRMRNA